MKRPTDCIVIGSGPDGLVAAIALARRGRKVTVLEAAESLGGEIRSIEFAPGFRAAPLAADLGWIGPDVARLAGMEGIAMISSDPTIVASGEDGTWLHLSRRPDVTAAALRRHSSRDADRWPAFTERISRLSGFLQLLYSAPPAAIDAHRVPDLASMLRLSLKLRGLGKTEMIELLRTVPMSVADLLDEWFEHDGLKGVLAARAVTDLCQGPMSGGTAFTLLHRQVGCDVGVFGPRSMPATGADAVIRALASRARAAGVELRAGAPVRSITIREDRAAGVVLTNGEEIASRVVISTADPYRTLLELLDPVHLDPELILAVQNIRFRGAVAKVLVGLDGLPAGSLPSGGEAPRATVSIAPSIRYVERAYDATKYGQISEHPFVEAWVPSLIEPGLAPEGRHVAVLHVQFTPYLLRESSWDRERELLGDLAVRLVDEQLPGFAERVVHRRVFAPPDLEREFQLREGAAAQGELMLDQILFMRPVAGWARYATPMPGLFLAGPGTHPGPGIFGGSGLLAAVAVLRMLR